MELSHKGTCHTLHIGREFECMDVAQVQISQRSISHIKLRVYTCQMSCEQSLPSLRLENIK